MLFWFGITNFPLQRANSKPIPSAQNVHLRLYPYNPALVEASPNQAHNPRLFQSHIIGKFLNV
jgi:hypothetical protein